MYVAQDYAICGSAVLLRGTAVRGAHAASFRHLYGYWARDDRAVYWSVFRRTKVDADTFEPLNHIWGRDAEAAYPASGKPIAGVNPREFRVFDSGAISDGAPSLLHPSHEGYAGDGRRVFFHHCTYPSAWEVKNADAASFVSLGRYGRDTSAVFYEQRMMRHAKPRSFRLVGLCGYAADDERVYYAGREIAGADPGSFAILWCSTLMAARDRHRYYYMGRPSTRDTMSSCSKAMRSAARSIPLPFAAGSSKRTTANAWLKLAHSSAIRPETAYAVHRAAANQRSSCLRVKTGKPQTQCLSVLSTA